ncbi:uncharacterized protein LOC126740727 [Anthonomus grandis grandis]|uniref:uncharacterized protein LOC126740727 n=1 Tax=Anthonomus grandis grandis TaxID=2921223 RepID=UPI002166B618|nr:uncharacterized protein LOC126740727 [Anthonomus grandis grandis]
MKRLATNVVILLCGLFGVATADDGDWQPLLHADSYYGAKSSFVDERGFGLLGGGGGVGYEETAPEPSNDQCALYKVGFTQDLYFQYIQYKTHIPDLKEFTLCYWAKFNNHSNDHPIFSYAVDGQPRAIYSWITNTERSSYFSMNIEGHTFYRLNYPLRLNRWYHTCQSWNGKTGEWQIWVNAERVGRGFHNRLVGHVIPAGGIAITGQSQSQLGGGFQEGIDAPKGSGGMLGEITMLQLYSVALTAGKAHKDHKHHHAHQYDHNGNMITTPAPTTTVRSTLPVHPLLTGGQLNRNTRINFAAGQQPQVIQGQEYKVGYANGQLVGGVVTQQLTRGVQQSQIAQLAQLTQQGVPYLGQQQLLPQGAGSFGSQFGIQSSLANPANVQYIDTTYNSRSLFKRHNEQEASAAESSETALEPEAIAPEFGDKIVKKREADEKKQKKRELFVAGGTIFDDGLTNLGPTVSNQQLQQSLLYGLAGIGDNQPILRQQKERDEREPAEAEVMAVMNICSGCDEEPFDKALVFGWRTVPKKLFSGAFYGPAVTQCRVF